MSAPVAALIHIEPRFADALARGGPLPPLARRDPGFGTLLKIILEQQVSVAAAIAMWRKLGAACDPLEPAAFLALGDDAVRACGFSRQKAAYGRALAERIVDGTLDLDALSEAPDDDAIRTLVQLRGIGRWSAEIYLMFALGRADVWPADDLAIQVGMQELFALPARPTRRETDAMAEPWRPHRSTAARIVWHHYLALRRRLQGA
jgi:DNA-3-methyladenine glycosylase II